MKRIGIITMHKVLNCGSALQAYALQKKICDLGYDCELIDYFYPNSYHLNTTQQGKSIITFVKCILSYFVNIFWVNRENNTRRLFADFYEKYFVLSKPYLTKEDIKRNPPSYDLYLTGSDQVWNPKYIKGDTTFMLSFAPENSRCISYASSIATSNIPHEYKNDYAHELKKYNCISVREESGKKMIKALIDEDAYVVCDPTILLTAEEWNGIASGSKVVIDKPYILVYVLNYSFNPYPEIEKTIKVVQDSLNLPIVILNGRKKDFLRRNSIFIKEAGPCEFVSLFKNASYVITTSFHGTVFSLIYKKPFAVMIGNKGDDSRIFDLLKKSNKEQYAITKDNPTPVIMELLKNDGKLDSFRETSYLFLSQMIENALAN